jgi:hypothetical protein
MKNIVYFNELSLGIKEAIKKLFSERTPEIISFPFKGRHMKGFFFMWENITYLIIKSEIVRSGNSTIELDLLTEKVK